MDSPPFDPQACYRFVFQFTHDDLEDWDEGGVIKLFHLNVTASQLDQLRNAVDAEELLDISEDLEMEYGVHDFSTTGWQEIAGYGSYEVEPSRMDELMTKWRNWFASQGYDCGEILTTSWPEYQAEYQG